MPEKVSSVNSPVIRDCGLMAYRETLQLQEFLVEQRQKDEIPNTVLIVEHPATITFGARKDLNELLIDEKKLSEKKIELVSVKRGGGATAHNPGQVVLYPIIHLHSLSLGINDYIRRLESVGIELLKQLHLNCQRRKGLPGLWLGEKKIASIGVRVKRWVTYHGMAINIRNGLSIFDIIVPCGIEGVEITSVEKETQKKYPMKKVKQILSQLCCKHFSI